MSNNTPKVTTPLIDTPKVDGPATPSGETQGYLSMLQRTATTLTSQGLNYINQARGGATTPDDRDNSISTTKGKAGPTAFERFMNLGKTRKDWEIEWPPAHWNEDSGKKDVVETVHPGTQHLCLR